MARDSLPAISRREELLDDLTSPGIEAAAAGPPGAPDRRSWLSRCAAAVQSGHPRAADLAALLADGQEVAEAFQVERYWPGKRGAAGAQSDGPMISAARAALDMAYAMQDPAAAGDRLTDAMARWRLACVLPPGPVPRLADSPAAPVGLPIVLRTLGKLAEDPAAGYAQVVLLALANQLPSPTHPVHVAVVFGGDGNGAHAKLTLSLQPGGPTGLYPDPRSMAFQAADQEFAGSLGAAWATSPLALRTRCVIWDISGDGMPSRDIAGASLGAAFGVGLDELARAMRPIGAARVRRLDPRCAITGCLDQSGRILPSGDYQAKFRAARRQGWRVIAPEQDTEARKYPDIRLRIDYVRDLRTAIKKSRLLRPWPHGVIAVILVLILTAGIAVRTAISQEHAKNYQHALELASQLADESGALGDLNPVLARLEAVAAWRIAPSSAQARYAMQNAASLAGIAVLNGPASGKVATTAFSPDGKILATVTNTTGAGNPRIVQLWDVARHTPIGGPLAVPGAGPLSSASFSPDGKTLAVGSATGTQLWDVASRRLITVLPSVRGYEVTSLAFSPDGKTLAAGLAFNSAAYKGSAGVRENAGTQLWDVRTRQYATSLLVGNSSIIGDDISSVAFSGDGKILAVATTRDVELWNAATHRQAGLISSLGPANSIEFAPHGTTFAIATSGDVELWDARTSHKIATLGAGVADVYNSLAFSPDGKTLAAVHNGVPQLWDAATGRSIGAPMIGNGNGSVDSVAFSPDGTVVATGSSLGAELWSVPAVAVAPAGGLPISGSPTSLMFSGDSSTLLVGTLGEARLLNVATRKVKSTLVSPRLGVLGVYAALSPDGKTAAAVQTSALGWLSHLANQDKVSLPGTKPSFTLAFSPDGKRLAVGSPAHDGAQLFDVATGRLVATLSAGGSATEKLAFSPNGQLLVTTDGFHLQFWNLATRQPEGPATVFTDRIHGVAFSPDGRTVAVATVAGTELLDSTTQRQDGPSLSTGTDFAVTWSPDGSVLAVSTAAGAQLWSMATRKQVGPELPLGPLDPRGQALALAWSPDGKTLAVATELFGPYLDSPGSIPSTGQLQLWNIGYLRPTETPSFLCEQARQTLTPGQWAHYAPGVPYQNTCP